MKRQDSKICEEWFKKADDDFKVAKLIFRDGGFMDIVGYHLHQAIEKYLKGFLVYNNQEYPLIHNLVALLKKCAQFDEHIMDYNAECKRMNSYFIEAKYPMDIPQDYPKDEIRKAIEETEFLIKYIRKAVSE